MQKEHMLGRIVSALVNVPTEMLGTLLDLVHRLGGQRGPETLKYLKHLLRGELEIKLSLLIEWQGTITIPATTETFVVREKFKMQTNGGTFCWIDPNFNKHFLRKIEDPMEEQWIRWGYLTNLTNDASIIQAMGGNTFAPTSLTTVFMLIHREDFRKSTDNNIFYVHDCKGALHAVHVQWDTLLCGWKIHVVPNGMSLSRGRWSTPHKIFSTDN